jgi:hypothetical protein
MERLVQVDREQLTAQMRAMVDQTLAQVMDAVNAAKDGRLIEDSEMPVFHLMKELERNVFEKALQLRVDSTESTFSPSQGCGRQDQARQGTGAVLAVDTTGPGRLVADEVLRSGRRKRRANRQAD